MGAFRWISSQDIPDHCDLRRQGWSLVAAEERLEGCVVIIHAAGIASDDLARLLVDTPQEARRMMLVSSVNAPEDRARLLRNGYGDAIANDVSLVELHARAQRIAALHCWVPRSRAIATIELDLVAREAKVKGKSLGLGSREFAMLWRLAERPDEAVSKQTLLDDVWRLGFVPESNSIAVQMSRMRGKLAAAGLADLIETAAGGYRLRRSMTGPTLNAM